MISDLKELKKRLTSTLSDNDFVLEQRTAEQRLDNIAQYSQRIPFASNPQATWDSFWLAGRTVQELGAIYQDPTLAQQTLPVQQAFLLALLQLLETPTLLLNTLPQRHRLLYYYDLLGFRLHGSQPDTTVVSFTLHNNVDGYLLPAGTALDAGQDSVGNTLRYLTDESLLITPQQLNAVCWTWQDSDVNKTWKISTALDLDNNIALPGEGIRLFTQTNNTEDLLQQDPTTPALYLGFNGVTPGETLSVYWSLDAPSALNLSWFYYSQSKAWASLSAGLQDGTDGLSGSALWRAILPEDSIPGSEYTALSAESYWIKAVPADGKAFAADNVPKLNAIFARAVTATLDTTTEIDSSHFAQPLAAGSISQLTTPVEEISSVAQPLPSVGGRVQETQEALLQRAATRIGHRQRAINWGNMRSMLMDHFPQLYDVQYPDQKKLNAIPAPVTQTLLAIPASGSRDNDDPLRPILSPGRLAAMTDWLKQYTSLWASPVLVNPTYIDVFAHYKVIFVAGITPDYGYGQLHDWLQQRYMPWSGNLKQAIVPGNLVDYYQLLATIQQSPLVLRVVTLSLQRGKDGESQQETLRAGDYEVLILNPVADAS